jgi:DNA repair exonuclease SbcCD ATPase subunit
MKKSILIAFGVLCFGFVASAQMVNKDSLSLVSKINSDKEKLAKLQNSVDEKTRLKLQTANKAQQSADENRTAANQLSNDAQEKTARRADNAASDARSDAKKARKAADQLDDLNKDIRNLTERIEKEQTKLNKYIQTQKNLDAAPTVIVPAMTKDSTKN